MAATGNADAITMPAMPPALSLSSFSETATAQLK